MRIAMELAAIDPIAAFAVFQDDAFAMLLDSGGVGDARSRYSYLIVNPTRILRVAAGQDPFPALALAVRGRRRHDAMPHLPPFQGGVAAWLSYDAGGALERLPPPPMGEPAFPAMILAQTDAVVAWDHQMGRCWVVGQAAAARALHRRLRSCRALPPVDWSAGTQPQPDLTAAQYQQRIQTAIDLIHAGDMFQVNLAQRFTAPLPPHLSPLTLYRRMRSLAPGPFGALLRDRATSLCSVSPERFVTVRPDGGMETRPIKGSRPRGETPDHDAALADDLRHSDKDRAENLMILDLMRNDFGRVCQLGTIQAPQRMELESFAAIHHLVSVVTGQKRDDADCVDVVRACFPPGSITGAPKIRAMQVINSLESGPRGPYCGAYGWFGDDGAMDLAVAIRIAACQDGVAVVHAGGGITAESDPTAEYQETMVKAAPILAALRGR